MNLLATGCFLDVEGVFDNIEYSLIDESVRRCLEASIVKSITSISALGQERGRFLAWKGFPQGGVISSLLWFIVVDEILCRLNEKASMFRATGVTLPC